MPLKIILESLILHFSILDNYKKYIYKRYTDILGGISGIKEEEGNRVPVDQTWMRGRETHPYFHYINIVSISKFQ